RRRAGAPGRRGERRRGPHPPAPRRRAARDRARAARHRLEQAPRLRAARDQPADARPQDRRVRPAPRGGGLMLAALLAVISCCLLAFGIVVYRADPRRWDNKMFAGLAAIDALTAAMRALVLIEGHQICDPHAVRASGVDALIGFFTIEFAYSFPFDR